MNTETLKAFLRKYLGFGALAEGVNNRPPLYRHWETILISFIVLTTTILVFSFYLFLEINTGDIFLIEDSQNGRVETIDRGKLEEVLTSFEMKIASFKERMGTAPRIPDPSR